LYIWTSVLLIRGTSQFHAYVKYRRHFCVEWVQLKWEVIVRFVDIVGIDDHYCLIYLFIMQSFSYFAWICRNRRNQVLFLLQNGEMCFYTAKQGFNSRLILLYKSLSQNLHRYFNEKKMNNLYTIGLGKVVLFYLFELTMFLRIL